MARSGGAVASSRRQEAQEGTAYSRIYTGLQIFARSRLQAWGRFVATHQITVLLLCCVVLCTLTYPTLSLYAWAAPDTTSDFFSFLRTSPTLDLLGADGSVARRRDLRLPWQGLDALVVNGEEACWQRIPKYREITVQQVLLGFPGGESGVASEHGVLDRRALHAVHQFEQSLHSYLLESHNTTLACTSLDKGTGCFSLSPMAYWDNHDNAMLSDMSLLATINSDGRRYRDLPLRHDDLFVGRTYSGSTMRKADYAVLNLFLHGNPSIQAIRDLVTPLAMVQGLTIAEVSRNEYKAVMKHSSDVKIRSNLWDDLFFFMGYIVVGMYIYLTLRRLDKVHSRSGLVITGIVQMLASGMMSLSLCALAGYKINLVPWKLIPFLIVVLGVDNMFVLTTAVSETSINLPVKERVAEGLGKTGLNILVNLLAELLALALLYFGIPTRVIREMVVFGATALLVDFSMEMTYFITVLSIDMQRLELADFLDQGSHKSPEQKSNVRNKQHRLPAFLEGIFSSLSERRARSYSSIILVGSNYLLYLIFGPEYFVPAFCSNLDYAEGPRLDRPPGTLPSASEALWTLLGARVSEAVHVHVNTPSVLLFDTLHGKAPRSFNLTQASIYAIVKYMIIPISATTLILYLGLRQLLKGSELLNSEGRNGPDADEDVSEDEAVANERPLLSCLTLEPHRKADIELLAASYDGLHTASWVPSERHLLVTPAERPNQPIVIPLRNILRTGEILTRLALSDRASHCAAATSTGRILIWSAQQPSAPLAIPTLKDSPNTSISHIFAQNNAPAHGTPPRAGRSIERPDESNSLFYVMRGDGQIECWNADKRQVVQIAARSSSPCRPAVLHCATLTHLVMTRLLNGTLEVWVHRGDSGSYVVQSTLDLAAVSRVTAQAVCSIANRLYLAVGDSSGSISVWDVLARSQIQSFSALAQEVRHLRLACCALAHCPSCGTDQQEGMLVISSSRTNLSVDRLAGGPICTCSNAWGHVLSRSTSNNGLAIPNGNHRMPSPRGGSAEEGKSNLAYPLSPHALRRLSHAGDRRKAEEARPSLGGIDGALQRLDEDVFLHSRDTSLTASEGDASQSRTWHHTHIGRLDIDNKTSWDILGQKVVGVRKRQSPTSRHVLARWETWNLPLDKPNRDASGLLATHSLSVHNLLQAQADQRFLDQQLPFDRVNQFFVSRDGRKVISALGNLVVVSTPL